MPFVKGHSGNPAGRPVGSRNKFTRDMQEVLDNKGLPVIDMIVEHAIDANPAAMRLCIDRLIGKHRPCAVELPSPEAPDYTVTALTEIHRALGAGEIASDEASRLVDFVGRTARVLASKAAAEIDVAQRLARCEEALLLLLNAGRPAAAPEAMGEPAIDYNNAETMVPRREDTGQPIALALADVGAAAGNNDAAGADPVDDGEAASAACEGPKRRANGIAIERLMGSTSPLAHLAGAMAEKMPPLPPGAGIGAA
jgi:hypothetical protein